MIYLQLQGTCSTIQRRGNGGNSVEHDQKLTRLGEAHNEIAHLIWAESNQQFVCKCVDQRPGNDRNSVENDQKFIKPGEAQNGLAHQIWAKSDRQFVCKYMKNAWLIRGQKTMGIQWSMGKS